MFYEFRRYGASTRRDSLQYLIGIISAMVTHGWTRCFYQKILVLWKNTLDSSSLSGKNRKSSMTSVRGCYFVHEA